MNKNSALVVIRSIFPSTDYGGTILGGSGFPLEKSYITRSFI